MIKEKVAGTPGIWALTPPGPTQCPGCHHPIIERAICEVLQDLKMARNTIVVVGVGCGGSNLRTVVNIDSLLTAHGRAPDAATAIKRIRGDKTLVFTLQGDGDCIAIGAGSLVNSVIRGEKITVIMVNNANFGTTGGQMAPTTLRGQITSTTPKGRDESYGYPAHVPELVATMKGAVYCARTAVNTPANFQRTKRYLKTAFRKQMDGVGFSIVEILSACPPDWHLSPLDSLEWIEEKMVLEYPLGEFKNVSTIE